MFHASLKKRFVLQNAFLAFFAVSSFASADQVLHFEDQQGNPGRLTLPADLKSLEKCGDEEAQERRFPMVFRGVSEEVRYCRMTFPMTTQQEVSKQGIRGSYTYVADGGIGRVVASLLLYVEDAHAERKAVFKAYPDLTPEYKNTRWMSYPARICAPSSVGEFFFPPRDSISDEPVLRFCLFPAPLNQSR